MLPIEPLLPTLRQVLAEEGRAVLVAPPGAGKTTAVPLALLGEPWLGGGKILLLEPRRLAARAAALRMAEVLGESDLGGTVGLRMRMETRVGPRTRIEVVTEGVLTRMIQADPELAGVGAVLFDEFHERSLAADLGLALALESATHLRPDLRLVVLSATLDAEPVASLLGGARVLRTEGRSYPVETVWRDRPVEGGVEGAVSSAVVQALEEVDGDLLVFLPGAGEIRRVERLLMDRLSNSGEAGGSRVHLRVLHGALPREVQLQALAPAPAGGRKVILATSIAETSLTLEGVRAVIDSGRMRVPRFDPGSGMTRLVTVRVTRDAADQRRGRAGRTAPGVCYRLWTRAEEEGLIPQRIPEIREADLTPLALELALWGSPPEDLPWLDPPPPGAWAQARSLLAALGLLDAEGRVVEEGLRVARLGVHPRIGHMLLRGMALGWGPLACDLAAILEQEDFLRGDGRAPDADLRLRVEFLARHRRGGSLPAGVDRGALERVHREARHLRIALGMGSGATGAEGEAWATGVLAAFAYPDRIARQRGGRGRFLLRSGRGARFAEPQGLEGAEWLVAAEVEGSGAESRIFRAAALDLDEIETYFGSVIEAREEVEWDPETGRVRAQRIRALGAISLSAVRAPHPDPERVAEALIHGIRADAARGVGLPSLPWTPERVQLRERLHFLHHLDPDRWPSARWEDLVEQLEDWLLPFLHGMRSLDDLARVALEDALLSRLAWEDRAALDRWAPAHLEVPSGSRIAVDYADPTAPVLAVRLQEVFGWVETPRLAEGRVPLTLHLLSPARRPVQVTRDLGSFWREGYFQVRKDLRGRYPKHFWPDDPWTAEPTRRTRPR
jgi:ATP-dependent helicase HrpB